MKFLYISFTAFLWFSVQQLPAKDQAPWIEYSSQVPEQKWYNRTLFSALHRVIEDREDVIRLFEALKMRQSAGAIKRDQILMNHQILSFAEFIIRIALQVAPKKRSWLEIEARAKARQASWPMVETRKLDYLKAKLTPEELVILFDFYRSIEIPDHKRAPESFFSASRPVHRTDLRLVRDIKSNTLWPVTPRRAHGHNLRKIPLDADAWRKTYELFVNFKMEDRFYEIWSQWVNLESGNSTTRHIVSFEDFFIFRCKEISAGAPYVALGLLQAYLVNRVSSETIVGGGTSKKSQGLTALLMYLNNIRNAEQAKRFFAGNWPEGLLNENTEAPNSRAKVPARIHRVLQNGPGAEDHYNFPRCGSNLARANALKKF